MPRELAPSPSERCPECGERSILRDRVRLNKPAPVIEACACAACGEWWFESGGARLTSEAIVRFGLAG